MLTNPKEVKESYFFTPRAENSRKIDLGLSSTSATKAYKSARTILTLPSDCLFCSEDFKNMPVKNKFNDMVTKALYTKYSSSQNYYYTKDINEILSESRTASVILFKDSMHFDEQEEYLKRFYRYSEYDFKIRMLSEYYKFHNDVARLFMMPITNVVNKHHDKKRRLEYIRVTKLLKEEQDAKDAKEGKAPKKSSKGEEKKRDPKDFIIADRILDELDLTDPEVKKHKRTNSNFRPSQPYLIKSNSTPSGESKPAIKKPQTSKETNLKTAETNKDMSVSHTLQDLNLKLGEIINSKMNIQDSKYLENSYQQTNETMSNLNDFLKFITNTQPASKMKDIPIIKGGFSEDSSPVSNLIKKMPGSLPLTDRLDRSDSAGLTNSARTKLISRDDLRPSDQLIRMATASTQQKNTSRPAKMIEKARERPEEQNSRPLAQSNLTRTKSNSATVNTNSIIKATTATPSVINKINGFEESLRVNIQNYQQKMIIQTSIGTKDSMTGDKILSANSSKNATSTRITGTRSTPIKQYPEDPRPVELSNSKKMVQAYSSSSNTARPMTKTKQRSNDMYTKALDVLLGSNQILLANNMISQPQRKDLTVQATKLTRSSVSMKVKGGDYVEKSAGRDDFNNRESTGPFNLKIASAKLPTDRIMALTERGNKKIGALDNLELHRREVGGGAPLSERELYRSKESSTTRSQSRGGVKGMLFIPSEPESLKSSAIASSNTGGYHHKYTKSEVRLKKAESTEKMEVINNARAMMNANNIRTKAPNVSPKRRSYTYNNNNIINVFVNTNHPDANNNANIRSKQLTVKTERQHIPEAVYQQQQYEPESVGSTATKVLRMKTPSAEGLLNKYTAAQVASKKLNLDFSPIRVSQRDTLLVNAPKGGKNLIEKESFINLNKGMSERSPTILSGGLSRRSYGKNEFEGMKRDLRFDNFEAH